ACPSFNISSHRTLSNLLLDKEYTNLQSNVNKSPIINYMITTPDLIFYKLVCTKEEHHTVKNIAKGIENVMHEINIDKFLQKEIYSFEIAFVLTINTRWISTFECLDHVLRTQAAIYAILTENSIELDKNIEAIIVNYTFWVDLKRLHDFLEPFIIFIRQLEIELCDVTLQATKNRCVNFLYNPAIIVAYMLNPRYRGKDLDLQIWADIINNKVIQIAGVDNKIQVLDELAEYIGKSANKLVYIYWNTQILRQLGRSVLINNPQETSVNSDNQELDINVDNDENEELNKNFINFSNWLLNTFDNCEYEFDNYSE
ncbi:25788_t:CDS:2, partial [Dentiscutata erythropus]